jgi:hypothetical protein
MIRSAWKKQQQWVHCDDYCGAFTMRKSENTRKNNKTPSHWVDQRVTATAKPHRQSYLHADTTDSVHDQGPRSSVAKCHWHTRRSHAAREKLQASQYTQPVTTIIAKCKHITLTNSDCHGKVKPIRCLLDTGNSTTKILRKFAKGKAYGYNSPLPSYYTMGHYGKTKSHKSL